MTVNANVVCQMAFATANLGSYMIDAGVSLSGNVATFDRSQSHRWAPHGPDGATQLALPAGYTKPAAVLMFNISRESVAPSATVNKVRALQIGSPVSDTIRSDFLMTEDTSRKWSFSVAGTPIPGQVTPTGTHHVMVWVTRLNDTGGYDLGWEASDTLWVTILIDKTTTFFNGAITAATQATGGSAQNNGLLFTVPLFGDSATDANNSTFTVSDVNTVYSDRANPIGKLTNAEWTLRLAIAPPAGFDQSTKSTGTDAAALVDERPPSGSGTTDGDYYQLIDDGTHLKQQSALAQNILSAGDVLYAVAESIWRRQNTSSKTSGIDAELHDGTNANRFFGNILFTGPSSYAENVQSGFPGSEVLTGGGSHQRPHWNFAPDGNAWSGKANAYLNGCFAGCRINGLSANASIYVDAIVVETAMVKSGDTISAIGDPGSGSIITTQKSRMSVV